MGYKDLSKIRIINERKNLKIDQALLLALSEMRFQMDVDQGNF